jgi:hypothetical protein
VPVRVDHARHHDPSGRVDLLRAGRRLQSDADRGDPVPHHQHVGAGQHAASDIHRQHRPVPQHDSPELRHDLLLEIFSDVRP